MVHVVLISGRGRAGLSSGWDQMRFFFTNHVIDVTRRELRRDNDLVAVEPQVFDILVFLIQNRDRVVARDDLLTAIWNDRIVSDATLTSRINAARKAVGDNGIEQRLIRTISKRGFRFLADVHEGEVPHIPAVSVIPRGGANPAPEHNPDHVAEPEPHRASIALMPFDDLSPAASASVSEHSGTADALVRDIITRLVKLRVLFVIAPGTMFVLRDRGLSPKEAGDLLKVDYIASGSVRRADGNLTVHVTLAETAANRVIWADVFNRHMTDAFSILEEIGNSIVASVVSEIDAFERGKAVLKPPSSLNAWEAFHRGLWHSFRMTVPDNNLARHFLETAIRLDPNFARAHAALSFNHFQNAFQRWTDDSAKVRQAVDDAYVAAEKAVLADERDPSAHWALGRALWLRGRTDDAIGELKHAITLGPSFAHGHYGLSFVQSLTGDPTAGIVSAEDSQRLSPFDPILFGVLSARAIALARLGRYEEAASYAEKSATRLNASLQSHAIAGSCLALAGRVDDARKHLAALYQKQPNFQIDDFLSAMRFSPDTRRLFLDGAKRAGIR